MKIANHVCSVFFAGLLLILAYNCKPGSTTPEPILSQATVTTTAATGVTTTGATLGGNVTGDGNAAVSERGVVYATTQTPTTANTKVAVGTGTGSFTTNVTGLTAGTTYYVRAYAINSQGTAYGSQETFTCSLALSLPTVTTTLASAVTSTGATLGGNVTADGNATVSERGVVYATTQTPTTANTKVAVGTGTGSFTTNVTGLTAGTTYYVRAYAINSQGTAYGSQETFTCSLALSLPTVSTTPAASITSSGATLGGNVTSDGNATVSEKGVVYATTANPTTSNTKVVVGTGGTGSYSTTVTGLTAGTTYYVRAYAINSQGTAYGSQVTFTTPSNQLPTASDYYLYLRVGNYLKFSGWDRTTIYKIVGTETINGVTYYIEEGSEIMNNGNTPNVFRILWLRKDSSGNIITGAYSTDGTLASKVIVNPEGPWFPNENLTLGYSQTFTIGNGVSATESVISLTATAGIYTNCIQIRDTNKVNGVVNVIEDYYYAYHMGIVKIERSYPASQIHVLNIIDYVNTP